MVERFFTSNYDAFEKLAERIRTHSAKNELEAQLLGLIQVALKAITFNRDEYDSLVQYTVERGGKGVLSLFAMKFDAEVLRRILSALGGFIREATLVKESRSDSEQQVLDYFLGTERNDELGEWQGYDTDYIKNVLPFQLLRQQSLGLGQLRANIEKATADSLAQTNDLESRIAGYRQELKKLESEYNFVGLSDGFRKILSGKQAQKRWNFGFTIALGSVALAIPAYLLLLKPGSFLTDAINSGWSPIAVTRLVASLGAEVVVLYYFRISLKSFLLAQTQATNLQLRLTLCQFIESYLEFANMAKNKSSGALQAFEGMIFGPLPSGDGALPATLDGLEQIAKIAQSLRKE